MFPLKLLRTTIRIKPETFPCMVTYGNCPCCQKDVVKLVFVYTDETPYEAFSYFWYSLERDCRFQHETRA